MYICVLVLCYEMPLLVVHTPWTSDPLRLTWEGSTLPAGLLTACYYIHNSLDRLVCCNSSGVVLFASVTKPKLSLRSVCASRVTEGVMGVGVASPLPLCWHSTVPRAPLRHLRRDATPARRHMTPTDVNPHSMQCHKRNSFKRGYCAGPAHNSLCRLLLCAKTSNAILFRRSFETEVLLCRSGVTNPIWPSSTTVL
jgi:hypothetical protein